MIFLLKNPLKNIHGFNLLELLVGSAISAIVIGLALNIYSSNEKIKVRSQLKTAASAEINEFFSARKKAIFQVKAGAIAIDLAGPFQSFTIPRTTFDSNFQEIMVNEVLQNNCIDLPEKVALTDLPENFLCAGQCSDSKVPISVAIGRDGIQNEFYPHSKPILFPLGSLDSNVAASLCIQKNANMLTLRLTYLLRFEPTLAIETISRTEIFDLPAAGLIPKPQLIHIGK